MTKIIDNALFTVSIDEESIWTLLLITNHSDSDLDFTFHLKDKNNHISDTHLIVDKKGLRNLSPSPLSKMIVKAFKDRDFTFTGDDLIVAKQKPPKLADFSSYFDDDSFTSADGENCAVYIFHDKTSSDVRYNKEEFLALYDKATNLVEDLDILMSKERPDAFPYFSLKSCIEDYGIAYSKATEKALCLWAKTNRLEDPEFMAEYLSITTSKEWKTHSFCGYYQGDYCTVLYCADAYSEEAITEIGNFWLGCGYEYEIDGISGYYVIKDIQWGDTEKLRATLAGYCGCHPKDLLIQEYVDTVTQYSYKNI